MNIQPRTLRLRYPRRRHHARIYDCPFPWHQWQTIKPTASHQAQLIITDVLLAQTLAWAACHSSPHGVSRSWFCKNLRLPSKACTPSLVTALGERGLIRHSPRQGWYVLLTLEEAIYQGKLAPGPWSHPFIATEVFV